MQTIMAQGGERLIVLSENEYEDLLDTRDAIAAEQQLATRRTHLFTEDEVDAYLAAPSKLAFWRTWRRVPAPDLATAAGISEQFLADLESGRAIADVATFARLARRLRTSIESLIPEQERMPGEVAAQ